METILIIEDEEVLADVLSQKLRAAGHTVELVRDGTEGISAIRRLRPALVILDVFLPGLNGIELLARKQADMEIATIPVIVLSNSLQLTQGKTLESLGAAKFLVKSNLTPDEVVSQVRQVLSSEIEKKTMAADIPAHAFAGKKILLVEDDEFLGNILVKRLESAQAEVTHARTGEEAITALARQKPDIALLDILLPGQSGFDVLEKIRMDAQTKDLRVIIVSNFNQDADKDRAYKLGASYLVKALVNPGDIVIKIGEVLGSEKQ